MNSQNISYKNFTNGEIYQPKDIPCGIDTKSFCVRLAETKEELTQVQQLLHKTFSSDTHKIKQESRDKFAHHLIACKKIDNKEKIVGTLRLINKDFLPQEQTFRSEDFFNIQNLLTAHKRALELSRFCVADSHRDKAVLLLLWKSAIKYILFFEIQIMFGLGTFQGQNVETHTDILTALHHNYRGKPEWIPQPALAGAMPISSLKGNPDFDKRQLPPVMKGYFSMGARFGDHYYIVPEFDGIFLFLYVKMETLHQYLKQDEKKPSH